MLTLMLVGAPLPFHLLHLRHRRQRQSNICQACAMRSVPCEHDYAAELAVRYSPRPSRLIYLDLRNYGDPWTKLWITTADQLACPYTADTPASTFNLVQVFREFSAISLNDVIGAIRQLSDKN